jgi:hypothetical protein
LQLTNISYHIKLHTVHTTSFGNEGTNNILKDGWVGGLIHFVWCVAEQVLGEWVGRWKEWFAWRTLDLIVLDRLVYSQYCASSKAKKNTTIRRVDLLPSSGGKREKK